MNPIFILFAFLCVLSGQLSAFAAPKLNLLCITADDMNADSPGWMGGKMGATPVLDALAATCHRFVNNHVTAPVCQPSREAMMTGRVPHRSGGLGFNPIKAGTPTMVTTLKAAGYYTAGINKTAHMKPAAEFPWGDDLGGSGKNPPLLREHFETTLQHAAAAKKPFFINVNIQYPHRPFPGSGATDAEEGDSTTPKAKKGKVEAMSGVTYKALEAAGKTDERIAGRVKQLRIGEPLMFFNENTDGGERRNSVADPNYRVEVERLAALLREHMEKTDDPQTMNFKKALAEWKAMRN